MLRKVILHGKDLFFDKDTCLFFYEENSFFYQFYNKLIDKYLESSERIKFILIDVQSYPDIMKRYKVTYSPTLVFIKSKKIGYIEGELNQDLFLNLCDKLEKEESNDKRRRKRSKTKEVKS